MRQAITLLQPTAGAPFDNEARERTRSVHFFGFLNKRSKTNWDHGSVIKHSVNTAKHYLCHAHQTEDEDEDVEQDEDVVAITHHHEHAQQQLYRQHTATVANSVRTYNHLRRRKNSKALVPSLETYKLPQHSHAYFLKNTIFKHKAPGPIK